MVRYIPLYHTWNPPASHGGSVPPSEIGPGKSLQPLEIGPENRSNYPPNRSNYPPRIYGTSSTTPRRNRAGKSLQLPPLEFTELYRLPPPFTELHRLPPSKYLVEPPFSKPWLRPCI